MPLAAGAMLGPYEILGALGVGGMGEVYRALDTRLQRHVAIKVLPHDRAADQERQRRFLDEARAASALNHPNIITLHDISRDGCADYLVMECVTGRSLDKLISSKRLSLSEVANYGAQIASALAVAHAAGIVHRDIKPANIMVTDESQIKILDFGLAKAGNAWFVRGRNNPDGRIRNDGRRCAGWHSGLYVARTGGRQEARSSHRHLLPGGGPVRDGGRKSAVPRRIESRNNARDHLRPSATSFEDPSGARRDPRQSVGQRSQGSVSACRRLGARSAEVSASLGSEDPSQPANECK